MTRTDESLGGFAKRARISSADARLSSVNKAFTISRSRRVRRAIISLGIAALPVCDICRILSATNVACQDIFQKPFARTKVNTLACLGETVCAFCGPIGYFLGSSPNRAQME